MFDTMTMTKVVAGLCGAWLLYLLGAWAAEGIYSTGGGHGDHQQAYVIEVEGGEAEPEVEEIIDVVAVMASASADDGANVFRKCSGCHSDEDGVVKSGPSLFGIVGRDVAAVDGFGYSGALVAVADVWDAEALIGFLENPKGYAPGTDMNFGGLKKIEDRANLIAYLDSLDD